MKIDKLKIKYLEPSTFKEMVETEEYSNKLITKQEKDLNENRRRLVELLKIDESKRIEDLSFGNLK